MRGGYVKVRGGISSYQGRYQITVQKMRPAAESEIDAADYLPTTTRDVVEMWAELRGFVDGFKNAELKRLVLAFLDDPKIAADYKHAPAATRLHHAWIGGLLEHVCGLLKVAQALAPFYPEADPDLVMTAAILHDIGKTRELEWKTSLKYTLEGQLVGHISIAMGMLREKVQGLPGFPERLRVVVEHIILSHHGKFEYGSPKLPMTPEAILFSMIDDLEAKMQAVRSEFALHQQSGGEADELTDKMYALDGRAFLNARRYLDEAKED